MEAEEEALQPEDITAAILRIQAGDHELFWRLVEPHQQCLKITAYSLLRNAEDAADVVQETNLKALKHLDQLKDGQSLKSWLASIAINEARMRMRRHREEPMPDDEDLRTFSPRDFSNWRDTPLSQLERKEILEAVQRALLTLSPTVREVFVLRDIQHISVPETAEILGISEAKVSVRLHRARLQMRELLAPLFRMPFSPWIPMRMMIDMPVMMMHRVVSCKTVIRELSKYIDGTMDAGMRVRVEEHLKYCTRCKILLDTTRKTLYLLGDERVFLPALPYAGGIERDFSSA